MLSGYANHRRDRILIMKLRKRNQEITINEFTKLRSFLTEQGLKENHIAASLGTTRRKRTRSQVTSDLAAWLRTRPKGNRKVIKK